MCEELMLADRTTGNCLVLTRVNILYITGYALANFNPKVK